MEDNQAPQWIRVRAKLRAEYGEAAYRSWLKPVSLISAGRGVVQISAPTKFMRDWVDQQYGDRLLELWSDEDPNIRVIDIVHSGAVAAATPARPATASSVWSSKYSDKNNLDQNKSDRNNNVGARLDSRFDFSNFVDYNYFLINHTFKKCKSVKIHQQLGKTPPKFANINHNFGALVDKCRE